MRIRINLDTLKIHWECPECSRKIISGFSDTADGWPSCTHCSTLGNEVVMEYELDTIVENVEKVNA
jgi:hypothetical protein